MSKTRRYRNVKAAEHIRIEACRLAVESMIDEDFDAAQMMARCVFFESYIAHGSRWVEKHMKLMSNAVEPKCPAPVLQLITRE